MSTAERPAVPHILVEHLEELSYLSIQRRKLLFSPETPLRRLRSHDQRMEAHLDGLRTAGDEGVKIAASKISGDDPWLVATAVRVWITLSQPGATEFTERLSEAPPELAPAWKEALRAVPASSIQKFLAPQNVESLPPAAQAVAVDTLAWHGILSHNAAAAYAKSPDPSIRFAIARNRPVGDSLLNDSDISTRRAALWAIALGNPSAALERSRQSVRSGAPDAFHLRMLGLLGHGPDGKLLAAALDSESAVAALLALRDLGHAEYADAVAERIDSKNEETAAAASDVLESLVGPLPAADKKKAVPAGLSAARHRWREARSSLDLTGRKLRGKPFPWAGDAGDEPMESVWRRACSANSAETAWLRREVPDGFFSCDPAAPALPGE